MSDNTTVLFVDDDKRIHRAWRRALSQEPYQMLFARSGSDAIQLLKGIKASVVVTDYAMPQGNGLYLLEYLKKQMPQVRTILVSGNATLTVAQHALNTLGIAKLFQKPCNPIELGLAIREQIAELHVEKIT